MSRIFGVNNHNTNVHNTNCTHFRWKKASGYSESRELSRSSIIIDRDCATSIPMAVVILKTLSVQLGTTSGCHVTDVLRLPVGLQDIKVAIPTALNLARIHICFVTV